MKLDIKAHGLTFHWPDPRQVSFLIPGFFLLAIFLHALTFYVFQIVYPPYVSITPPPAEVSLLTPDSVENQAMLRWIEAEDPAALLVSHELDADKLLNIPYRPSFAGVRSLPRVATEEKAPIPFPDALDAMSVIRNSTPRPARHESAAPMPGTVVQFSSSLADREIEEGRPFKIGARSTATLEPSRFLIGVTDRGEVRYVFLQSSSGDKSMDAQAEAHLREVRFAPDARETTWGFVGFLWGSDAFAPSESNENTGPKSNDPR